MLSQSIKKACFIYSAFQESTYTGLIGFYILPPAVCLDSKIKKGGMYYLELLILFTLGIALVYNLKMRQKM